MKLKKIHRAIEFTEKLWMKDFIAKNTIYGVNSKSENKEDLYKLFNNSVFHKTVENVRKRVSIGHIRDDERLKKCFAKPNFNTPKFVNSDLILVRMKKVNILLNKPIYCGMAILKGSQMWMYNIHYNFII